MQNDWQILGEKKIYDNKWIGVTEYDVINPGGGKGIYGKVHFKNTAVGVLVLDEALDTYLVGQFRFTLGAYSWEIPEGGKRELLEETGLVASEWTELFRMHLSNSVSDELGITYLARYLQQEKAEPEETENLVIKKIPFAEAFAMVQRGEITDSMSVAAIYKVQYMLATGTLK